MCLYLAARVGFEPTVPRKGDDSLANCSLRPLGHRANTGGRQRSRTPSLLREPGFQGQSQDHPRCIIFRIWYREAGSNRPHLVLQTSALPTELSRQNYFGESYEDRTRDSGITTRGFTTKLTTPYYFGRSGEIRTPDAWFRRPALFH